MTTAPFLQGADEDGTIDFFMSVSKSVNSDDKSLSDVLPPDKKDKDRARPSGIFSPHNEHDA